MARKNGRKARSTVVDDDDFEEGELETGETEEAPPETVESPAVAAPEPPRRPKSRRVSIDVELGPKPAGIYVTRHVEVRLEGAQAETLRKVFDGLALRGARLDNGRYVSTVPDAVRWLLEELAKSDAKATE